MHASTSHAVQQRPARPARAMTEAAKRIVSIWGEPREATPLGPVSYCPPFFNLSFSAGRYVPQTRIPTAVVCTRPDQASHVNHSLQIPLPALQKPGSQYIVLRLINSVVEIPSPINNPFSYRLTSLTIDVCDYPPSITEQVVLVLHSSCSGPTRAANKLKDLCVPACRDPDMAEGDA